MSSHEFEIRIGLAAAFRLLDLTIELIESAQLEAELLKYGSDENYLIILVVKV